MDCDIAHSLFFLWHIIQDYHPRSLNGTQEDGRTKDAKDTQAKEAEGSQGRQGPQGSKDPRHRPTRPTNRKAVKVDWAPQGQGVSFGSPSLRLLQVYLARTVCPTEGRKEKKLRRVTRRDVGQ